MFTKRDLQTTYHQIPTDLNFKEITTIKLQMSLLCWKRIPHRIKMISVIFENTIEQVMENNIKNLICYHDNIYIGAVNERQLKRKINLILNRLRHSGMKKMKKLLHNSNKISFWGYSNSKGGVSPNQVLIEKLQKVAVPTNKKRSGIFFAISKFFFFFGNIDNGKIQ